MNRATISCESCERLWPLACTMSFFEKQTLESRPCPHCGAYTLVCQEVEKPVVPAIPKIVMWNTVGF